MAYARSLCANNASKGLHHITANRANGLDAATVLLICHANAAYLQRICHANAAYFNRYNCSYFVSLRPYFSTSMRGSPRCDLFFEDIDVFVFTLGFVYDFVSVFEVKR